MYAIVRSGGKQYKVARDTVLAVEKLDAAVGDKVRLDEVLLIASDAEVRVGAPCVPGASVTAEVVEQFRGKKINGFTYRPTKRTQRKYGHRQSLTRLKVVEIEA